jgi:hypothetical protein
MRTKDLCWFVGTIYDHCELPGVSTTGSEIGRGVTLKPWGFHGFSSSYGLVLGQ